MNALLQSWQWKKINSQRIYLNATFQTFFRHRLHSSENTSNVLSTSDRVKITIVLRSLSLFCWVFSVYNSICWRLFQITTNNALLSMLIKLSKLSYFIGHLVCKTVLNSRLFYRFSEKSENLRLRLPIYMYHAYISFFFFGGGSLKKVYLPHFCIAQASLQETRWENGKDELWCLLSNIKLNVEWLFICSSFFIGKDELRYKIQLGLNFNVNDEKEHLNCFIMHVGHSVSPGLCNLESALL